MWRRSGTAHSLQVSDQWAAAWHDIRRARVLACLGEGMVWCEPQWRVPMWYAHLHSAAVPHCKQCILQIPSVILLDLEVADRAIAQRRHAR